MKRTALITGGTGFLGRRIGIALKDRYHVVLTADFRARPLDTVSAHVCNLLGIVRHCDFDSFLYLSSARVYSRLQSLATEDSTLQVAPLNQDDLYNVSKIMGEALLFASGRNVKAVRISNVYGGDFASDNFLANLIKDAISKKSVTLHSARDSEKDYISLENVVDGLIQIVTSGKQVIYNLASGVSVSNQALVDRIAELTGCQVEWVPNASKNVFPKIDVSRMREEFHFSPANIIDDMPRLIRTYSQSRQVWNDNNRS